MPPEVKITKQDIIDAAFELIREDGSLGISARKIAKKLNCSTQPVYSLFNNMEELKKEVEKYAGDFALDNYLLKHKGELSFLGIGLGYIKLAKEDPNLFKFLYLSGKVSINPEDSDWPVDYSILIETMRTDKYLKEFDDEILNRLLRKMWIFTHGLTAIISANQGSVSDEFILESLHEMGRTVVEWEYFNLERNKKNKGEAL